MLGLQTQAAVDLDVEGGVPALEDLGRQLGDAPSDVVEVDEGCELPSELEQRRRALGLTPCRLVQAGVLDGHGRVSGEDFEQPDVVLVELVQAELRDDDHADDPRPVAQRHGQ